MPIRVLLVSSKFPPEYSGSGLRAHRTYQRLSRKYDLIYAVLCSSVTDNTSAVYPLEGARVTRIAAKIWPQTSAQAWDQRSWQHKLALRVNYFSEFSPVWRFLRQHQAQFDVVHVFGNCAVTSAVISFCNRYRKPLLIEMTYDTTPRQYKPWVMRFWDREPSGFHPGTRFVCISEKLAETCRRYGITHPIWTRPNPVDVSIFHVDRLRKQEYRGKHSGFGPRDVVLVNVSKFMPLKNQIFLLDVLQQLPQQYKLVLAGPVVDDGPNSRRDREYIQDVKEKIVQLDLDDRVKLKEGFITRPDELMKMADVYVFPSKLEGLGTPMIESLCCGVPVVANRLPGVTDAWIKEGQNGWLSSLDPVEFAQKIERSRIIPETQMEHMARQMQSVAGVESVDEQYFHLLRSLAQDKNKQ